ncbi:CvpA family protein [Pseudoflavonifractor phocaeensis]|uniref:CvpA family protein n=1 Tax=Pseudoflavonifractor phocaeensis TaxID=1870988 RepID=UPI00195D3BDE|nr:CvpA family protein [Pseudoflavonifractor phocaeensis]MBM6937029.1 CvpA family protein [Pseudoflavonifractor phocaeensis]
MSYLLLDLLVLAVIALFVWRGAAKGFALSLCGLLAFAVAFGGASVASRTLSPAVAQALEPRFAAAIGEQLNQAIQNAPYLTEQGGVATLPEEVPVSGVLDVLRELGVYEDLIQTIDQAVEQGMTTAAANAAAAAAAAVAQSVAYRLIFVVSFALIMAAWTLLSRALNLVAKLPGLRFLNKTAGALVGLVKAALILFLAGWVIQCMGNVIPEETVQQTVLLRFFLENTPLSLLAAATAMV